MVPEQAAPEAVTPATAGKGRRGAVVGGCGCVGVVVVVVGWVGGSGVWWWWWGWVRVGGWGCGCVCVCVGGGGGGGGARVVDRRASAGGATAGRSAAKHCAGRPASERPLPRSLVSHLAPRGSSFRGRWWERRRRRRWWRRCCRRKRPAARAGALSDARFTGWFAARGAVQACLPWWERHKHTTELSTVGAVPSPFTDLQAAPGGCRLGERRVQGRSVGRRRPFDPHDCAGRSCVWCVCVWGVWGVVCGGGVGRDAQAGAARR